MFQSLFGSRSKGRSVPVVTSKFACEELGDRIVPSIVLNEIVLNPPGTSGEADRESIEIRNTNATRAASDLNGITLLVREWGHEAERRRHHR
jgi:hypothetical protein